MTRFRPILSLLALALSLSACATHQLRFHPYQGIPADEAEALKHGRLNASPEAVFDAVATTLEHEPYLHWSIQSLDKVNGFIKAEAGLLRELQVRITRVDAAGASGTAVSQMAVSIPRRELKTDAKVWIKGSTGFMTAYEPEAADLGAYRVVSADAVLNADYLRSFTWHVLHDRVQVPFSLQAHDDEAPAPLAIDEAPAQTEPAATLEPTPEATPAPSPAP